MRINKINQNYQPTFQAKVSEKFVNSLRKFINNGENRLKNNYILTEKIKRYEQFGYNDYTVEMHQKSSPLGFEYSLVAVRDGDDPKNGIILAKRTSYRAIYKKFMSINNSEFRSIFKKNKI